MANLPNPRLDKGYKLENHGLFTAIGGLVFAVLNSFNPNKSNVVQDNSYIELSNNETAQSKIRISSGGHILVNAAENLTLGASKHMNVSVKGDSQEVVAGNKTLIVKGDYKISKGNQDDKEMEAAKKIQEITEKIQEARLRALKQKGQPTQCPVCNVTHLVDNKSALVDGIFDFIRKILGPFFCFPFDTIHRLVGTLVSPILSQKKNIALTGSAGCGSPACKSGMVESPVNAMKAADKAVTDAIKQNEKDISKYSEQLGTGGNEGKAYKGDVLFRFGLKKNNAPAYSENGHHVFAFYLEPGKNGNGSTLALGSRGSAPKITFAPPQRTHGSVMFDVSNNFTVNAGSPGIDMQTTGRFNIMSGDLILNANQGEAVFGSGNVTTIKGKNIIIDADDQSGDSGLSIQSQNTLVNGSFNVRGDAAFKGQVTTDGAVSTPFLIVPSMRSESTVSCSSKMKAEGAVWNIPAAVLSNKNLAKDVVLRYTKSGYATSMTGIFSLTVEVVDAIMQSMVIEPYPTGIFAGMGTTGPCSGWIFNWKHTHMTVGGDHSHEVTIPKGSYWHNRKAWGQERTAGSPVPTPNPAMGDSMAPGPRSKPGGCGGGSLYTKNRNENYKLNPLDPFNGSNYIKYPITRSPDGTLNPAPVFSVMYGITGTNIIPNTIPNTNISLSALPTEECPP